MTTEYMCTLKMSARYSHPTNKIQDKKNCKIKESYVPLLALQKKHIKIEEL